MPGGSRRLSDLSFAGIAGICGLLVSAVLIYPVRHWPVDDAYIHLRIVRNLVEYGTLSFNQDPTGLSTTSPLWNLLCAGGALLGGADAGSAGELVRLSQLLATGFVGIACAAAALILRPSGSLAVLVGVGMIATDPYLTYAAASAMEMPLYVAAVLAILLVEWRTPIRRRRWASGLLLAAALQVRPEAATLIAGLLLSRVIHERRPLVEVFVDGIVIVAFASLWWAGYFLDVGEFLPRSVLAKSAGENSAGGWFSGSARQVLGHFGQAYLPFVALVLAALLLRWRKLAGVGWRRLTVAAWIWLAPLTGYVLFLREPLVSSRYMCALLPGIALLAGWCIASLADARPREGWIAAFGIVAFSATVSVLAIGPRNARGASLEPERIAIGEWIARETDPQARVYAHALGYIGFHCERYCIGGAGLVDTAMQGRRVRTGSLDWAAYLDEAAVDYYVSRANPPVPATEVYRPPSSARARPLRVWRLEEIRD